MPSRGNKGFFRSGPSPAYYFSETFLVWGGGVIYLDRDDDYGELQASFSGRKVSGLFFFFFFWSVFVFFGVSVSTRSRPILSQKHNVLKFSSTSSNGYS